MNRDAAKTVSFVQFADSGQLLITRQNGMSYAIEISRMQAELLASELVSFVAGLEVASSG